MARRRLGLVGCAMVSLLAVALLSATGCGATDGTGPEVDRTLARIKQLTAKYQDVKAAVADGYRQEGDCVSLSGEGAMGIHYARPDLNDDPKLDLDEPEMLLYEPGSDGKRTLVGVEYVVEHRQDDHPELAPFGHLDGPMGGHFEDQPTHYDLHVWIWRENPAGVFAIWNPDVHC